MIHESSYCSFNMKNLKLQFGGGVPYHTVHNNTDRTFYMLKKNTGQQLCKQADLVGIGHRNILVKA